MTVASEKRIQELRDDLKTVRGELSKAAADLNETRVRIRTAVAEFKHSFVFESYTESRRQ